MQNDKHSSKPSRSEGKKNVQNTSKSNDKKKEKGKMFPNRVKTSAIEKHEIETLKLRYQYAETSTIKTFSDMPISKKTLKALKECDYVNPTEIQSQSILLALKGLDILGAAKTGSGKTLAFVIPVLERLFCEQWTRLDGLGALIITPTRELAYQIFETFRKVGYYHDFSAGLVIGGKDLKFERKRLDQCNIMICTPGRVLHHMDENPLFNCSNMKILVIDEADRCLDLGFEHTMNGIIENLPPERQTLLFSATQTKSVKDLARLSLTSPVYVSVHEHAKFTTPESLRQSYIVIPVENKIDVLWSFLRTHKKKKMIIFMTCCKQVRFIHQIFSRLRPGVSLLALYGTMHQLKRMSVYEEFCRKENAVLFATDIAARGLDFPAVDWVVQMDCPEDVNSYIHRAGRTARFQKGGQALLMLMPTEEPMIEQLQQKKIPIEKIDVNPAMMVSIQRKLEAMLAKEVELKQMAQRAFVTYIKAVFLMKDKSIFDVMKIDLNAFSRSMGLAVAPRVRFLQKRQQQQAKKETAEAQSSTAEEPSDDEVEPTEDWRKNDFKSTHDFNPKNENASSDSDDDILTLKRKDHELVDHGNEAEETGKKKKTKILTKEKVAKRILAKKLKANKKIAFDEEGNRIFDATKEIVSDFGRALELEAAASAVGGINLEQAKKALQEEDAYDKELFRQRIKAKHREERLRAKAERRAAAGARKGDNAEEPEGEESDYESSDDEEVADIISALPDPDRIYGEKEDVDDDGDFYTGPPVARKRVAISDDEESDEDDDGDSEDESMEEKSSSKGKLLASKANPSKRTKPANTDEDSDESPKKKWTKKKPPKKVKPTKPAKSSKLDTGLDLALDEELALHLLGSK